MTHIRGEAYIDNLYTNIALLKSIENPLNWLKEHNYRYLIFDKGKVAWYPSVVKKLAGDSLSTREEHETFEASWNFSKTKFKPQLNRINKGLWQSCFL